MIHGLFRKKDDGSFALVRNELKSQLVVCRSELGEYGMRPICPVCGKQIREGDPIAMHEVLITRGAAAGSPYATRLKIHDRRNVVLVHNNKCHELAATKAGSMKCAEQITCYEGREEVMQWLTMFLEEKEIPVTIIRGAMFLVTGIQEL